MRTRDLQAMLALLALLLSTLTIHPPAAMAAAPLVVHFINVGQGDSTLVRFPSGQTMLVDAGDSDHGRTVVNYLRRQGVKRIDILVATHPHEDHIGGMPDVLSAFPVGKVWDSGYAHGSRTQARFLQMVKARRLPYGTPRAGFSQRVGTATVAVLAPVRLIRGTESDANNNSLVLRVAYGQTSFLLGSDMEGPERETVRRWPPSTVLRVPHHGSENGVSRTFVRQVSPKIAVISYGRGNPYGHPSPVTVAMLRNAGAKVMSTAANGSIRMTSYGKTVAVAAER